MKIEKGYLEDLLSNIQLLNKFYKSISKKD